MAAGFVPKQLTPFTGDLLDELQGRVSIDVAAKVIPLLPKITSSSVIHDNGCGTGAVTEAVVSSNPPSGFKIEGTDVTPMFLDTYRQRIEKQGWPAHASSQDAMQLSEFGDDIFTHSMANFLFFGLKDDSVAAKEMLRTLKKDGAAVITVWHNTPHIPAIKAASKSIRGADVAYPPAVDYREYKGNEVKSALVKGGFKEADMEEKLIEVEMPLQDARIWAQLAWSFLGTPVGGWTQADEDNWDRAIDEVAKNITSLEGCRPDGEKGAVVKMTASAVIARK